MTPTFRLLSLLAPTLVSGALTVACVSRTDVFEDIAAQPRNPDCTGSPLRCAFDDLPELPGVSLDVRGDTAFVSFAGFDGAADYRITALSDPDAVATTSAGRVIIRDAIYRCAGDRQIVTRPRRDSSEGDVAGLYTRAAADALLGHVYLDPGAGRVAVRRLADPEPDADVGASVPSVAASRAARYVPEGADADALLEQGYRDDGIVFYAPTDAAGSHPIHFWQSAPLPDQGDERYSLYLTDGAEYDAIVGDPSTETLAADFRALDEPALGSVPLERVLYRGGHPHDVLAAGDAQYERVLDQGNRPLFRLAWPGLSGSTTLVVEALDQGCPFQGLQVPDDALADKKELKATGLDDARLSSGEVFVNGQHDAGNRPNAIARSFVTAAPLANDGFDRLETFDTFPAPGDFTSSEPGADQVRYDSADWIVEATHASSYYVGAMLGQLWLGQRDDGGGGTLRVQPKASIGLDSTTFTHVSLRATLPATQRRYPQLLLRAGANGLVVQTLGVSSADLAQAVRFDVQLCQGRQWQPDAQCPRAELEGRRLDDPSDARPWAPVPVVGELTGFDLPIRIDVLLSTERVYLWLDERPAGCAFLPSGALDPGPLQVAFGDVSNDSRNDEASADEKSPHKYLRAYSPGHDARRFDDLGVAEGQAAPDWNEALFPCSDVWSG